MSGTDHHSPIQHRLSALVSGRPALALGVIASVLLAAPTTPAFAQTADVKRMFDVRTPMRDGVELSADVWMPAEGGPFPTIIIRTPYLKTMAMGDFSLAGWATWFAERGYAVVMQDVRGRGDSDGDFDFFFQEGEDGYDTIEWMAAQPWSNGDVCTAGVSYLGTDQWLAAREHPPSLKCMVATAAAGRWMHELPYYGGAWMMSWALDWINGTSGRNMQTNTAGIDMDSVYWHRPLLTQDDRMGRDMPLFNDFLENSTMNEYWQRLHFTAEDFRGLDLPVLHVTGWFDGDQPGAMFYWDGMMAHSPAADEQYMLTGPWGHAETFIGGTLEVGEMSFKPESIVDNKAEHLAFFDHYLKGSGDSYDQPRARVYVMGAEEWREFDQYPPADAQPTDLYLSSGGRANSIVGDGTLAWSAPEGDSPPDRFTFDPRRPVPAALGVLPAGEDRTPLQRRDDVLVYTSEVIEEAVEIVGKVVIEFHAATDARDTDFVANIMDVYPDGRAVKLGPITGVVRARYRNGFDREELLTPGEVGRYEIDLGHIAHSFEPGHRIRIDFTSSAYPHVAPNQNTGNPVATDTEWNTARQIIHHSREYPSRIILPVRARRRATE
ncbi:MAG: CocE/NonD family hydrolase [Gemmatimonadetes bacterium]|nr:CocE/NonD family hydrolase [Gemmatimonadota bacterium]